MLGVTTMLMTDDERRTRVSLFNERKMAALAYSFDYEPSQRHTDLVRWISRHMAADKDRRPSQPASRGSREGTEGAPST